MTVLLKKSLFALMCLCGSGMSMAQEKVTLVYSERPPYLVSGSGGVSGIIGSLSENAFKTVGTSVSWVAMPVNRQFETIKANTGAFCAAGLYKTAEREEYAKFTTPLYRDRPWTVLANAGFKVRDGLTLEEVISTKSVRVLVKENSSYGAYINDLLVKVKPHTTVSNGTIPQMLQLINANSADLMFISEEEADYLVGQAGLTMKNFNNLKLSNMPKGEFRYLMCSKMVSDDVILKLNKAIKFK